MNAGGGTRTVIRREVRVACWIQAEGCRRLAHTSDLSSQGLSLALPWSERQWVPAPGLGVSFQLALGEALLVEGTAKVSWVDPDDRDHQDRRAVGVGLEFVSLEGGGAEALSAFVLQFRHKVVIVDTDPEAAELYAGLEETYEVFHCQTPEEALAVLKREEVSVLLVAEVLPGMDCLQFFSQVSQALPKVAASRVVACEYTAVGQLLLFVNLGKLYSYLRKPFDAPDLHQTVRRAVDGYVLATEQRSLLTQLARANERLREENAFLRQRSTGRQGFEAIVGDSAELRRILEELARAQRADSTVHLFGETGTGKELCARALHSGGARRAGPFVVQSCAAISEGLVQSTLFGYRKGAFTGAEHDHPGVFQQADGGTLFLDEVGELSAEAQAALLRVLQEGEVHPLGAPRAVPVDVRIVTSSSRNLRELIQQGLFREDLFFRLMVLSVRIPPLRERPGDVAVLAAHFLDSHCERQGKNLRGFTGEAMRALELYRWPGNVRELSNEIERVVLFADDDQKVHTGHLSRHLRPRAPTETEVPAVTGPGHRVPAGLLFDEAVLHLERALVRTALERAGGNVTHAASSLQMERSRLAKLRDRLFAPETT